jgi:hypothetical protein
MGTPATEKGKAVLTSAASAARPPSRHILRQALAIGLAAGCCLSAAFSVADVPPAKPYGELVEEVVAFLFSDVGIGGIRTNDDDPEGYPVPPYFYHYAIKDSNALFSGGGEYPGYDAVSYPGYTASVGIDAFLAYRRYSGSSEALARARAYADWILEHRTPATDTYGNLPYSTQTDAVMGGGWDGPAIMTDKPAMFGLRLLRLYDITDEDSYWQGAREIAAVLAANQLSGDATDNGRWPFRVVPLDGSVTQDYTGHLQPAVRFFDAMAARTGDPAYAAVRDRTWQWLLNNPGNPAADSYQRWEGFYEDQTPEMQIGKRDHYSAHEMIVELTGRRPFGWQAMAATILDSVADDYLITDPETVYGPYVPCTLEWEGWEQATYAASLQFARTALLLHQALADHPLQDQNWHDWAYGIAAVCSHGQNDRGIAADGRMFTTIKDLLFLFNVDSWYEQNFNTVKYYLELMALDPRLATTGETHLLSADRPLREIVYPGSSVLVRYMTAGGAGRETIKLASGPARVTAAGFELPQLADPDQPGPGWHYNPLTQLLTVDHPDGPVVVTTAATGVAPAGTSPPLATLSRPGTERPRVTFVLERPSRVTLDVIDLRGRLVQRLIAGEQYLAGRYESEWNGRDTAGRHAPSGLYFARLETALGIAAVKLLIAH